MLADYWQTLAPAPPAAGSSGALPIADMTVMAFSGPDAPTFLQGYLTCDTTSLQEGATRPAALCNLKGRVVTFGWAQRSADALLYLIHESLAARLDEFMRPYLAFAKTDLARADQQVVVAAVHNERADDQAQLHIRALATEAELETFHARWGNGTRGAFERALIDAQIPWLTASTSERFLPQALNLVALGAVDFDKGCYLGQEVVARAQHRGKLKRHLRVLELSDGSPPQPGAELRDSDDRNAGTVIQSVAADADGPARSLCVLQDGARAPLRAASGGAGDLEAVLTLHS